MNTDAENNTLDEQMPDNQDAAVEQPSAAPQEPAADVAASSGPTVIAVPEEFYTLTIEDVDKNRKKIYVEVAKEEIMKRIEDSYRELRQKVLVNGFRKGHVPDTVLRIHYGREIQEDITRDVMTTFSQKALKKVGVKPVFDPDLSNDKVERNKPFKFDFTFLAVPAVALPELASISVTRQSAELDEAVVDRALEDIRVSHASYEVVEDRPVNDTDYVSVHITAVDAEGNELADIDEETDIELSESSDYHGTDLKPALVGRQLGELAEISMTFPTDMKPMGLAGQTVTLKVLIRAIRERVLPELNDELAQDEDPTCATLEELRNKVRNHLQETLKSQLHDELVNSVVSAVVDASACEVPEELVERRMAALDYRPEVKANPELRTHLEQETRRSIKRQFVLQAVAETNRLNVMALEVDAQIRLYAEQTGQEFDHLRQAMVDDGRYDAVRERLLTAKIHQYLFSKVQILGGEPAADVVEPPADGQAPEPDGDVAEE